VEVVVKEDRPAGGKQGPAIRSVCWRAASGRAGQKTLRTTEEAGACWPAIAAARGLLACFAAKTGLAAFWSSFGPVLKTLGLQPRRIQGSLAVP